MPVAKEQDRTWYAQGLAFECRGCGNCCRGPGGYVWVGDDEIRRIASALGLGIDEFGKKFLRRTARGLALVDGPSGDCVLLDNNGRCRVYAARPQQCRTYPWWPEVVRSRSSWKQEQRTCPGIGQGRVYSESEIQAALDATS